MLQDILDEVAAERAKQDDKWGPQHYPNSSEPSKLDKLVQGLGYVSTSSMKSPKDLCEIAFKLDVGGWAHILFEEFGEAVNEADLNKLRYELIQVAAVAVAWIEDLDKGD